MTTITAETKRHVPTIPLALPSYAYPPMNSTYNYERAEGIYNKGFARFMANLFYLNCFVFFKST